MFCKGVVHHFHAAKSLPPFNAVIVGSVPLGGGVSSSASVEVATYTFLEELTADKATSEKDKALACQAAEHSHAGIDNLTITNYPMIFYLSRHAMWDHGPVHQRYGQAGGCSSH